VRNNEEAFQVRSKRHALFKLAMLFSNCKLVLIRLAIRIKWNKQQLH